MIYHKWSLVGLMLWIRYALLGLRPWRSLTEVYARYLESPGTKAYSVAEARALFADFKEVRIRTLLTHGDLLESGAGQRRRGLCWHWPDRSGRVACCADCFRMLGCSC